MREVEDFGLGCCEVEDRLQGGGVVVQAVAEDGVGGDGFDVED